MRLIMLDAFRWNVEFMNTVVFGGSLENAVRYLEYNLGVDGREISNALKDMRETKLNSCSFGVNGTFICTHHAKTA